MANFGIFFGELKKKSGSQIPVSHFFAESEGFEPPDPLRSTVFKTAAFDHSANSPILFPFVRDCKGTNKFEICKYSARKFAKRYKKDATYKAASFFSSCVKKLY